MLRRHITLGHTQVKPHSFSRPHLFELAEYFERVAEIAAGFSLSYFVLDLAGDLKVEFVVFKGLGVFLEIKVGVAQLTA